MSLWWARRLVRSHGLNPWPRQRSTKGGEGFARFKGDQAVPPYEPEGFGLMALAKLTAVVATGLATGAVVASKGAKVLDEDLGWFRYEPDDDDDDDDDKKDDDDDKKDGRKRGDGDDAQEDAIDFGSILGDDDEDEDHEDHSESEPGQTSSRHRTTKKAQTSTDDRAAVFFGAKDWPAGLSNAERIDRTRALYENLLQLTQRQMAAAESSWEEEMLATTERALRRSIAIINVRHASRDV